MIYWIYEREIIPYKYEGNSWKRITPENIRSELECVDESQKYVTEYLDAKKKSEALSVPALILIAGGLTGILISPLFGKKKFPHSFWNLGRSCCRGIDIWYMGRFGK